MLCVILLITAGWSQGYVSNRRLSFVFSTSKYVSLNPEATNGDIESIRAQLVSLQGTPELVDKLENIVSKFPGIELDIDLYRSLYPFKLDDFQEEGIRKLIDGKNVIVTTPTGSGKTLVGELAIYFSLMMGLRVAYTTPLKALSNQKFADFKAKYGGDRVGLLTGDIAINRGAPITDSSNQLSNIFVVIFDEFHYMNDADRGTVWEECVISCPSHIRILALSATMGNVVDIKGWFESIHGPTELISSTHRPVPLRYLFALKSGLMPLFRDPNAGPGALSGIKKSQGKLDEGCVLNPSITKLEEQALKKSMTRATKGRPFKSPKPNPAALVPRYSDVAEDLHNLKLLPAIVFIFSRVGCEQSAKMITSSKTKLLADEDVRYVTQAMVNFAKNNPEIPIQRSTVNMIKAGVAVHHAGLIPVWKAFIEDLFNANKIKVLFATETLAAGVNMPARTTVITSVTKKINSEVIK
jgi:superfamily II RNA helicase